jgi:Na+-translocating ferredoxin:NAD+ oxidoreductase subunit G
MRYRPILLSALFLFLFAVIGSGLVALTFDVTAERIVENQRRALLRSLNELVPQDRYDNDIYTDLVTVPSGDLPGITGPVTVYRARKEGWPVAAVMVVTSAEGYSGSIRLLVAINMDGTLTGVRVIEHRETPGLGDAIERAKSDWILAFNGKSLADPVREKWNVKRDGGVFDQFTGATITPRAVVKAVRDALIYFTANRQALFEKNPESSAAS